MRLENLGQKTRDPISSERLRALAAFAKSGQSMSIEAVAKAVGGHYDNNK